MSGGDLPQPQHLHGRIRHFCENVMALLLLKREGEICPIRMIEVSPVCHSPLAAFHAALCLDALRKPAISGGME
ncbi:MAG: hypothetical protein ACRYGK_04805 [Janthinobacterium lividum]